MSKLYTVLLCLVVFSFNLSAQTITSKSTGGNWDDVNTWMGGVVPGENNDVIINGTVTVTSGTSCNNLTINSGKILQNGGGLGWLALQVRGNCTNNGTIRNNPGGNSFQIVVWGNAFNNGIWNCTDTFFPAQSIQYLSQASGKFFDSQVRRADNNGYAYDTGNLLAASDLTFTKNVNLEGYLSGVGSISGTLDMVNHNLTLSADGNIFNGIVLNTADLIILENARLWNITFEGNTTIKGRGRIDNSNVTFKGSMIVADTLQNGGGLGWLAVHIDGSLTNNGFIKNNYAGNALQVEVWGDVQNNGIWNCTDTFFPGKNEQHILQSAGMSFDTEVRYADAGGYAYNTGKLIAASDITFKKGINLQGYISNVGYQNGTLYMDNNNLNLTADANIFNGTVKDVGDLTILENARLWNMTFEGNTTIKGRGRIENSNVTFVGNTTIMDTLQNSGGLGWLTPVFNGDLINYGTIKNNDQGNQLWLNVHGNVYNYGIWKNVLTNIYTDGIDRTIFGSFSTQLNLYKSGDPKAGRIIVDEKLVSAFEVVLKDGIEVVVNEEASFINNGAIKENGFVTNNGIFTSTHNLDYFNQLNSGLNARIDLVDRLNLVDATATSYKNSVHPLMMSSIKQWWRVIGNGAVGTYKITLTYSDDLLNGNDENNLELYLSPDSGKTWKKISTPINTTHDLANNTITVGNNDYPVTAGFGDFILSSGDKIQVPSISAAIGGRKQIRVGPPNRYSISYWNNNNYPTDKFFFVLNTNQGVHIKSIFTKEIESGKIVEIPIDSLTYDGYQDEVILMVQGLSAKEVRSFDVILTSEPGTNLAKVLEPITFTAIALWVGGAILEEYISNTIVEGCYEMWRPVSHDQSLKDASLNCVANSMKKAATSETAVKGVAKKAAEEIIKKTGRVAVWPVMLAKDMFDCLGNTIKGMKDYVNGNFDKQGKELVKVTSWDPNEKEGPTGYGSEGFMATSAPMTYTIFFENKKEATAAAYEIVIVDTLDQNVFDINSVVFGDMSHSMGVTSKDGNILLWQFTGIELPPNVNPPEGEGWVKLTVWPKNNLPTGTQLTNRAAIKFDLNPWLATNQYVNTLDYDPPVTTPTYLYRVPGKNQVELVFDKTDGSGAGVKNTMIYMANNDSPFTLAAVVDSNSARIPVEPNIIYKFYTLSQDYVGNSEVNPTQILEIMTDVKNEKVIPAKFELEQNYPNPFNPVTTIQYSLPEKGFVELKIYSILGEEVATLVKEQKNAGYYNIKWQPTGLASGIYLYQIKFNSLIQSRKMIYLK